MPQLVFKPGEKAAIEQRQQSIYTHPWFRLKGAERPINAEAITSMIGDIFTKSPPFSPAAGGASVLGGLAALPRKGKAIGEALSGLGKAAKQSHDEIIAAFKAGTPGAEETLVKEVLVPMARKSASRFKGRGVDAEDISQNSVMKGLEAARQWKDKGSNAPLPGYLKTSIDRSTDNLIRTQGTDVAQPQQEYRDIRKVGSAAARFKSHASTAEPTEITGRGVTTPRIAGEEPGVLGVSRKTGLPAVRVKEIMGRETTPATIDFDDLSNLDPAKLSSHLAGMAPEASSEIAKRMMEAGLTERQLRAVNLSMGLEGEPMSVRQIAKEIGVASPNAVQSQLKAAMVKLKKIGEKTVSETTEALPTGSEWFKRATSQVKGIEEKTGSKLELGESLKPARRISGGSAETPIWDTIRLHLDKIDPTWRDQLKKGQSGMGGWSHSPQNKRDQIINPQHENAEFIRSLAPKVYSALESGRGGQITFQDPNFDQLLSARYPQAGRTYSHPTGKAATIELNPFSTPRAQQQAAIHEPLHAFYSRKSAGAEAEPRYGADILRGHNYVDTYRDLQKQVQQQGHELLTPGHGAIYALTDNILKSLGRTE